MIKCFFKYIIAKWRYRRTTRIKFMVNVSLKSTFEPMTQLHPYCKFHGSMGMGSYIGRDSVLSAKIGRFTSISRNVVCNSGVHPYQKPYVSTSPCFYSLNPTRLQCGHTFAKEQLYKENRFVDSQKKIAVEIGNDVWIGERVFLVGGIHIYDGAMVLAGAVVTKDVPPYAIVGGVPAKVIKYRYDEETIKWLLNVKWWEKSRKWFEKNWQLMTNIEDLKRVLENSGNC